MTLSNAEVRERLDELVSRVLPPLRSSKVVDGEALDELVGLVEEIGADDLYRDTIPTSVAGTMWFIYYSMLDEAEHARDPRPIVRSAARYQESLRRFIFGPHFGGGAASSGT